MKWINPLKTIFFTVWPMVGGGGEGKINFRPPPHPPLTLKSVHEQAFSLISLKLNNFFTDQTFSLILNINISCVE